MTDSTQTLICPACGKEMQKIFVERTNCYIDICTEGCGGIFFDNREYKKYMLQMKAMWQIEKEYSDEEKAVIAAFDSQLKQ